MMLAVYPSASTAKYLLGLSVKSGNGSGQPFDLHRVVYDGSEHETHVEPTYKELRSLIDAGALRGRGSAGAPGRAIRFR